MKLPRNLTGAQLIKALEQLGYDVAMHHDMTKDGLIQKTLEK